MEKPSTGGLWVFCVSRCSAVIQYVLRLPLVNSVPMTFLSPPQPFFDDHPLGIYEKVCRTCRPRWISLTSSRFRYQIIANRVAFPSHVDPFAKDLIRRLLTADRSKRLGNLRGGAKDVMAHRWFTGVDWDILASKKIGAPIIPHVASRGESFIPNSGDGRGV